jgi:hypothetical protein
MVNRLLRLAVESPGLQVPFGPATVMEEANRRLGTSDDLRSIRCQRSSRAAQTRRRRAKGEAGAPPDVNVQRAVAGELYRCLDEPDTTLR